MKPKQAMDEDASLAAALKVLAREYVALRDDEEQYPRLSEHRRNLDALQKPLAELFTRIQKLHPEAREYLAVAARERWVPLARFEENLGSFGKAIETVCSWAHEPKNRPKQYARSVAIPKLAAACIRHGVKLTEYRDGPFVKAIQNMLALAGEELSKDGARQLVRAYLAGRRERTTDLS